MIEILKNYAPVIGIFGALIVFIFGRFAAYSDRKRSVRSYIKVEAIDTKFGLKNLLVKKGSKLIMTENYEEIIEKLKGLNLHNDQDFINQTYFGYIMLKNIGPGIVINGKAKMTMSTKKNTWNVEVELPMLEVNEEIYMSTDNLIALDEKYFIDNIEIKYNTQLNETIIYQYQDKRYANDKLIGAITETYYILSFKCLRRKQHESIVSSSKWFYIN